MKEISEEVQVIKSAIKFYRAAVKEYAVLGNINEVLQSMIDDLVAYTYDPVPGDWQSLAAKLYNDLSILEKAAQDNGVTNASVLSPLSSAGQIARNLTKLNKSEPTQKLQHYYEAIRNNLCDALKNISPDPEIRTQKSMFSDLKELCFDVRHALYSINSVDDMMLAVNSMEILKDAFDRSPVKDGKSANLIHRANNNILLIGDVIKDIQSGRVTFAQAERAIMGYRDIADDLLRQFEISYIKSTKIVNHSKAINLEDLVYSNGGLQGIVADLKNLISGSRLEEGWAGLFIGIPGDLETIIHTLKNSGYVNQDFYSNLQKCYNQSFNYAHYLKNNLHNPAFFNAKENRVEARNNAKMYIVFIENAIGLTYQ